MAVKLALAIFLQAIFHVTGYQEVWNCHHNEQWSSATCSNFELEPGEPLRILKNGNESVDNLERLTLNNVTGVIDRFTFTSLPNLGYLWIKWSKIENVTSGALAVLPKLILLVLKSNNEFPDLDEDFFQGTNEHLSWLSVVSNPTTKVNPTSLNHLKNLTWLHLQHQDLEHLPGQLLNGSSHLHELTIMHCGLKEIDSNAFDSSQKLEILSLNFNKIESFKAGTFKNLRKLKILELHHNPLMELGLEQFKELVSLEVVGFPSPLVKRLEVEELLKSFPNLRKIEIKRLDLDRNETKHLVRELRRNDVHVIGTPHDCHFPHPPFYSCTVSKHQFVG